MIASLVDVRDVKRASHHGAKAVLKVLLLGLLDSRERKRARVKHRVAVAVEEAAANPVCARSPKPTTASAETSASSTAGTSKPSAAPKRPAKAPARSATLTSPETTAAWKTPTSWKFASPDTLPNAFSNFLDAVFRQPFAKRAVSAV